MALSPGNNNELIKTNKRKFNWKLWGPIIFVAIVIGAIGRHNDDQANKTASTSADTKPASTASTDTKPATPTKTEFKDGDVTPDTVKAAIEAKLGKEANTDKKPAKVAKVVVNDDLGEGVPDGSKIVILTLNGNDGLTETRKALWIDTLATLKTLAPNPKMYELNVDWQLPLVDANGNDKDGVVMQLKFTRPQIDKINFDNYDYNSMPVVAKNSGFYWEHPAIRVK